MMNDIGKVLYSEEDINKRVTELGAQISADYADKMPVLISVLKGGVVFMADLMRAITIPIAIDFMSVSSYGSGVKTSGVVKILKDLDSSIEGRHVLIVEDILDTGMTLSYLREVLMQHQPASVRLVTLLDKPERRLVDLKSDYCGFVIPDEFVVGYGLDYANKYRNLPFVGILKPEVYGE